MVGKKIEIKNCLAIRELRFGYTTKPDYPAREGWLATAH
jgi:hypothetical protein